MTGDAALLLTNRISPARAEPLRAREFWALRRSVEPQDLLGLSAADISGRVGDPELGERVAALLDAATGFALAREELESKGILVIGVGDHRYPDRLAARLGDAAPPVLFTAGPIEWLDPVLIGVVGSRNVSDEGAVVATRVAKVAARHKAGIVSGAARGVDLSSMNGAYETGVPSVGVTAEGLERASRRKELRGAVGEQRLLLVSPFEPGAGFSAGRAMGRNKIIYALACSTLVVASDLDSGGTWAGATETLRRSFGNVVVWMGAGGGPGNAPLVERGAEPLTDLDAWNPTEAPAPARGAETTQLGLGI